MLQFTTFFSLFALQTWSSFQNASAFSDLESECSPTVLYKNWSFPVCKQYLCFFLVRVLSTYTCSSKCNGLSKALGRGPRWTSLHTALSAPVRGQGSYAITERAMSKTFGKLLTESLEFIKAIHLVRGQLQLIVFTESSPYCPLTDSIQIQIVSHVAAYLETIHLDVLHTVPYQPRITSAF